MRTINKVFQDVKCSYCEGEIAKGGNAHLVGVIKNGRFSIQKQLCLECARESKFFLQMHREQMEEACDE